MKGISELIMLVQLSIMASNVHRLNLFNWSKTILKLHILNKGFHQFTNLIVRDSERYFGFKVENMKILAIEKELVGIDWSNKSKILENEARQVYKLSLTGYLREIYFNENRCAVLIIESESIEKANELLHTLPLVVGGLIKFELMQLLPYTGLDRIIKSG